MKASEWAHTIWGRPAEAQLLIADLKAREEELFECQKCLLNEGIARNEAEAEVARLRDTVSSLNRRCQLAESAARENVEVCRRQGVSLGRSLANWTATKDEADASRLRAEVSEQERAAFVAGAYYGYPWGSRIIHQSAVAEALRRFPEGDPK